MTYIYEVTPHPHPTRVKVLRITFEVNDHDRTYTNVESMCIHIGAKHERSLTGERRAYSASAAQVRDMAILIDNGWHGERFPNAEIGYFWHKVHGEYITKKDAFAFCVQTAQRCAKTLELPLNNILTTELYASTVKHLNNVGVSTRPQHNKPVSYVSMFDTREDWLNAFVSATRPIFENAGFPLPEKVRVSIGFTSSGKRGKSIGECWNDTCSDDGHFEIFLKPTTQTASRLADILTHELCHAAVGLKAAHGKRFRACAIAMGLEGKMTSTIAGVAWYHWALPVLERLGPIPYAAMALGDSSAKPKQKTNLLKVECGTCGWLARVTAKWVHPYSELQCPDPDCSGTLHAAE
jgi:hypothetical protein